jgi:hypothetical protein
VGTIEDFRKLRECAIEYLEKIYREQTENSCQDLYNALFAADIRDRSTQGKVAVLRSLISDKSIRDWLDDLNRRRFHPVFLADPRGRFVWMNHAAKHVFADFDLHRDGPVAELYNNGIIFDTDKPRDQTDYRRIYREAYRRRGKTSREQTAFTKGNELVFFYLHRLTKSLVTPVTACLYVTTLNNRSLPSRTIGTLGMMAVPLYLRDAQRDVASRSIFVSMPYKPEWTDCVYAAIKRAIVCAGYRSIRIDEQRSADINREIRDRIQKASFIIADVTDANPNVMEEVGYAFGLHKEVILITQDLASTPFNIASGTQEEYDPQNLDMLCCHLFEMIKGI